MEQYFIFFQTGTTVNYSIHTDEEEYNKVLASMKQQNVFIIAVKGVELERDSISRLRSAQQS